MTTTNETNETVTCRYIMSLEQDGDCLITYCKAPSDGRLLAPKLGEYVDVLGGYYCGEHGDVIASEFNNVLPGDRWVFLPDNLEPCEPPCGPERCTRFAGRVLCRIEFNKYFNNGEPSGA